MVTQPRPDLPVPPALSPMIESWGLCLAASLAPKTPTIYLDAVRRLAGWLATERPGVDWGR